MPPAAEPPQTKAGAPAPSPSTLSPDSLPPGQVRTHKFPVVGEQQPTPEALDRAAWRLVIAGLVEHPQEFSYDQFLALPQTNRTVDIHCVTGWSHLQATFRGVPLHHILERAEPRPKAKFVRFLAYSNRGHDTTLPLAAALADTWLVHQRDGLPLSTESGGPLRSLSPSRYFYKSLKWLHRIELLAEDQLGYWERESRYHNVGDPWAGDQRFVSGSLPPEMVQRFREATSFNAWRGPRKVLLGLDLRGWKPKNLDLHAVALKNCDLTGAHLTECNLRGANLTLSNLSGADLRLCDFSGADLEGCDFCGADMRGANIEGTALSAARFFTRNPVGELVAARVEGLRWANATGLLEQQEAFLLERALDRA